MRAFEVVLPTEHADHCVEIEASVSAYVPPIVSGPPDRWAPAEGGEIEFGDAWLIRGDRRRRLNCGKLVDRFAEIIDEQIVKQIEEGY